MAYRYTLKVGHQGSGKYRIISGPDRTTAEAKAEARWQMWEHDYRKQQAKEQARVRAAEAKEQARTRAASERRAAHEELEAKKQEAAERTSEAERAIAEVKNTLLSALEVKSAVDWEKLKANKPFPKPDPKPPVYLDYPPEPQPDQPQFQPAFTLLDTLIKSRMEQKAQAATSLYERNHASWTESVERIRVENERQYAQHVTEMQEFNHQQLAYEAEQAKENEALANRKAAYEALQPDAIIAYCELVLSHSEYPNSFPQDFELDYNADTKILIVEYSLPAPENLPRLKEVKFVKSKDDFSEVFLSDSELAELVVARR